MEAVLFGVTVAVFWGIAELQIMRVAKGAGALTGALWLSIFGGVGAVILAPLSGMPEGAGVDLAVGAAVGLLGLCGTAMYFLAMRDGQLTVISPVIATNGGIAALLAVLVLGESLPVAIAIGSGLAVCGVVLASTEAWGTRSRGVGWAVLAAIAFGAYTAALSVSADDIGPLWAVLVYRAVMVVILLPFALARGGAALPPPVRKPMLIGAACDIVGFTALAYGLERGPVAVVSVIGAQFATIAVVLGAKVLGERMRPHQWVGVGIVLVSVSCIALARY